MISITLPLLGLAALGAAQSSTVSLFLPMADSEQSLVASIAGSDSSATTYVVGCAGMAAMTSELAALTSDLAAISAIPTASAAAASGIDNIDNLDDTDSSPSSDTDFGAADCGFLSSFTVIEGPSTVHYSIGVESIALASINCALSGTTKAVCTASASLDAAAETELDQHVSSLTTTTLTGTDVASGYIPVVVTAGSAGGKSGPSPTSTAKSGGGSSGGSSSSGAPAAQATNAAVAGGQGIGAGLLGALGVAVAGAML